MELREYPLEFVERTIQLIEKVSRDAKAADLDVTFLMNCTLGLIVATSENIEKCNKSFFEKRLHELEGNDAIPKKIALIDFNTDFRPYRDAINKTPLLKRVGGTEEIEGPIQVMGYDQAKNLTLLKLIKYIRNGVAHQNIMPINRDRVWKGIRIWNHNRYGIKDFEVEFNVSQLKKFCLFLAEKYVEEYNQSRG